jgi:hypothetical protein
MGEPTTRETEWNWRLPRTSDLLGVVVLAVLLRASVFAVSIEDPESRLMNPDSWGYLTLAQNLLGGEGFGRVLPVGRGDETVWMKELCRTPGYPLFLTVILKLNVHGPTAAVVMQHLIGIAIIIAAMTACGGLFGRIPALLVGLVLALDFQQIALSNLLMTATLFGGVLMATALVTSRAVETASLTAAAAGGLLAGLGALIKPTALAMPAVVGGGIILFGLVRRRRRLVLSGILLGVVGSAVIGAWIIRNGRVAGEYTLSTIPRYNLLFGHAQAGLARSEHLSRRAARLKLSQQVGMSPQGVRFLPASHEENQRIRHVALTVIEENLPAYMTEFFLRTANTLAGPDKSILTVIGLPWVHFGVLPPGGESHRDPSVLGWALLSLQLLITSCVYLFVMRSLYPVLRRRKKVPALVWVCLGLAGYVLLLSSGPPGNPRFRAPAVPLLVIVAAASVRGASALPGRPGDGMVSS